MNVIRVTSQIQQYDHLHCRRCNIVLPVISTFCGNCGMRVDKDEVYSPHTPLPSGQSDITARYRITSLMRRRPKIQLSFAWDMQLQSPVVLRDIDISGLDETARKLAYAELQQEYALLEHQQIADLTPLIASYSYEGHLYSIASCPFTLSEEGVPNSTMRTSRPYTLHDLLQSGIGIPNEHIAISWIRALALAVERLHECQIIIGELDLNTIILSSHDYNGQPVLMVSWIPARIRHTLSQISNTVYPSNFRAPETLHGRQDGLTDIYSLGALLYLLLTGITPDPVGSSNASRYRQRTPRDLNPHISSALAAVVMQAMALEPDKRFQHASELEEALHHLQEDVHIFRLPHITFARPPKSTPTFGEETLVSFNKDNNENSMSKEAQLVEEPNDKTSQLQDIQEQLARSYLSRINTEPLSSQEKQTGEATVDKVSIQEKQTQDVVEDKVIPDQGLEEMPTSKNKQVKKGKKRSNKKIRISDEASFAEVQAQTIESAEAVKVSEESSNEVPLQEIAIDVPTEEVCIVSLSENIEGIQAALEVVYAEEINEEIVNGQEEIVGIEEMKDQDGQMIEEIAGVEEMEVRDEAIAEENEIKVQDEEIVNGQEEIVDIEEMKDQDEQMIGEIEGVDERAGEIAGVEEIEVQYEVVAKENEIKEIKENAVESEKKQQGEMITIIEEKEAIEDGEEKNKQDSIIVEIEEITSKQEAVQIAEKVVEQQKEVYRERYIVPTSQAIQPKSTSRSDMLPTILSGKSKENVLARIKDLFIGTRSLSISQMQPTEAEANKDVSFLQRVQRFILGEQKHSTMAVALIEMPMRIQPTQSYALRIQIIGRDQQTDETQAGGLSALAYQDIVHIEVRLALYQSYAYMVQQADVVIPTSGYAAEVMVPMLPLASGPSSRRERLQIFFMDKDRNPLYEKPFVIEIFVSPLVQLGNEGHNVLSIPM